MQSITATFSPVINLHLVTECWENCEKKTSARMEFWLSYLAINIPEIKRNQIKSCKQLKNTNIWQEFFFEPRFKFSFHSIGKAKHR